MERLLSESETLVADSARTLCRRVGQGARHRRAWRWRPPGFDRAVWAELARAGWFGVLVPEALGGMGEGTRSLVLLLEEAGRALLPEPAGAGIVAAALLAGAEDPGPLSGLLSGERVVVPALRGGGGWPGAAAPRLSAGRLSGRVPLVHDAAGADAVLVAAVEDGAPVVLLVPRTGPGVAVEETALVNGGFAATLAFEGVVGVRLAAGHAAGALVERGRALAALATAGECQGVMDAAFAMTVDYLKQRRQFGQPVGAFQALQHRAASLMVDIEVCRSLTFTAAEAGTVPLAAAARARAVEAALRVTKACIQLHGAIGFADEHDVGLYLRHAMALAGRGGPVVLDQRRFAAGLSW
ncbi:MAG TPA: acyl-CoA dehydrogenase family protein [Azospirillum sp.]|nr:acyl-CoA dehydrogenase family protein [Azospirillum sp.]